MPDLRLCRNKTIFQLQVLLADCSTNFQTPSCIWLIYSTDSLVGIKKKKEILSFLWVLSSMQLITMKMNAQWIHTDLWWFVLLFLDFWTIHIFCSLRRAWSVNYLQCSRFPWGFPEAKDLLFRCCDLQKIAGISELQHCGIWWSQPWKSLFWGWKSRSSP